MGERQAVSMHYTTLYPVSASFQQRYGYSNVLTTQLLLESKKNNRAHITNSLIVSYITLSPGGTLKSYLWAFCRHLKHKEAVEVQWKEQCGQLLQPEYFQQSPTGSMAQDGTQVPARKSIFVC